MASHPDASESRRRYDQIAAEYDRDAGQPSGRFARFTEAARKRAVAALDLEPGQTVLDLGCGTGASFERLVAGVGPGGRVVGVDQSAGMLQVAARRIDTAGWGNVELLSAPVESAPLPAADAALFFFTHDLLRTPAALDNGLRAVRPAGRVAAAGLQRSASWLGRLLVPAQRVMRRYVTTTAGLDRPWDLLADRLVEVRCETLLFGAIYVVGARRPAAAPG